MVWFENIVAVDGSELLGGQMGPADVADPEGKDEKHQLSTGALEWSGWPGTGTPGGWRPRRGITAGGMGWWGHHWHRRVRQRGQPERVCFCFWICERPGAGPGCVRCCCCCEQIHGSAVGAGAGSVGVEAGGSHCQR